MTVTDPLSHTTTYGYDAANEPTSVTRADGGVFRTAYDPDGRPITQTDALTNSTTFAYDSLNRLIAQTDPLSRTTRYGYDLAGNRVSLTDPLTRTTTYTYDLADRLIATVRPDTSLVRSDYDPDGNVITATDPLSHTTSYGYDALDRQVSTTDPLSHTTAYGYDAEGNLITSTDPLSRPTTYGYDALNRLISVTDPLTRTTSYSYDLVGNQTVLTTAAGLPTDYGYDADHELTGITYALTTTPNVTFTYTASGRRASMSDGTGTSTYGYDALDRVITNTTGAGQMLGYGYDLAGNLTHLVYPDTSAITRTYDAANRLTGLTDWLGHTTSFSYDAADNLLTQTYPNTTTAGFTYNAANQLTKIVDSKAGVPQWSYTYGRDALGQLSSATDLLEGRQHSYSYTLLNALALDQSVAGTSTLTSTWSTNGAYEITQVATSSPATMTLGYDVAHEVTSQQTVLGAMPLDSVTLSYNATGDRTGRSDSVSGASTTYGYDQADRLITVTNGITSTSYLYDGDGLRQSKTVSGTTTAEVWDVADGLPQLLMDGSTRYLMGPSGLPLELLTAGGTVLYYYQDQLGSTRALLGAKGTGVASYTYGPNGALTTQTGTTRTPFGFAGQYTDSETGFQYLRARYYDLATLQFLSLDPLVDVTGQPYAYADDNPLNATDPTGLDCSLWALVTGGCRLPTGQEAQATWRNEVKPALYGSAVQITGLCDAILFGQCSHAAQLAGANVLHCSSDYQFGQRLGLPVNAALVVGTGGLDGAADAALAEAATSSVEATADTLAAGQDVGTIVDSADTVEAGADSATASEPPSNIGFQRDANGRFTSSRDDATVFNRDNQYPHDYRTGIRQQMINNNTIAHGPNAGMVRTANGEIISSSEATIEHMQSVAEHWNTTGRFSSRIVRNDFYNDLSNLTVLSHSTNSSEGARLLAEGGGFIQEVGPGYSP